MKAKLIVVVSIVITVLISIPLYAESKTDSPRVYFPFESLRLVTLIGEHCDLLKMIRDDVFENGYIFQKISGDPNQIINYCLIDVRNSRNEISNLKSLAEKGDLNGINDFFRKTGVMITKDSAMLSCVRCEKFRFRSFFSYHLLNLSSIGDSLKNNTDTVDALNSLDKILQKFQRILEENENNCFEHIPYELSILEREYDEICNAINQKCTMRVIIPDKPNAPSAKPFLWD